MIVNNKKRTRRFILINFLLVFWLTHAFTSLVQAASLPPGNLPPEQTDTPTAVTGDKVEFSLLGFTSRTLQGPIDSSSLFFSIPADWELLEGASLQLDMTVFLGTDATGRADVAFGGVLAVSLNNVFLDSVLLDQAGPQMIRLPLPPEALVSARTDGRYQLKISLDSGQDCNTSQNTAVVINRSSFFLFPHREVALDTDLALLPRPIYQRSFTPDTALIVVPDEPTAVEMEAALNVAAGFGKMTNGQLALRLTLAGDLTAEMRSSQHLIAVGQSENLAWLEDAPLPAAMDEADADDGLIQMAVSPWNPAKVVLAVSGESETAVRQAAQALSSGSIRPGIHPNAAVVNQVNAHVAAAGPIPTDRTLADLGYPLRKLENIGNNESVYEFFVPSGQAVTEDAYLNLALNHSALLDFNQSGLTVILNDEVIGSARLTQETAGLHEVQIAIPGTAVRPGVNSLNLKAELFPFTSCGDLRQDSTWLIIRSESALHLPLGPGQTATRAPTLSQYPIPFASDPTLSQTAFVLPAADSSAWDAAARLAADLGRRSSGILTNITAEFGDDVSDAMRQERDLIIVGRPSLLPLLTELNDVLPAPFNIETDQMAQDWLPVSYRLPATQQVGYLQQITAPWNEERTILIISGDTDEGVSAAADALIIRNLRMQLTGAIAMIDGEQIFTDSRQERYGLAVAEAVDDAAAPTAAASQSIYRPGWIVPALILAMALIVVIAVIVYKGRQRDG